MVGVLRGLCFQDTQAKGTTEQGTNAGRSNKYYHWPIATESLQLYSQHCVGEDDQWTADYLRLHGTFDKGDIMTRLTRLCSYENCVLESVKL